MSNQTPLIGLFNFNFFLRGILSWKCKTKVWNVYNDGEKTWIVGWFHSNLKKVTFW